MRVTGVRGIQKVMGNLNRKIAQWEGPVTMGGLIKAVAVVRNATEKEQPSTPVDIGNLRASWLTVTSKGTVHAGGSPHFKETRRKHKGESRVRKANVEKIKSGHASALAYARGKASIGSKKFPAVAFGYGAYYAMIQHENLTFQHSQGQGALWFQKAIERNQGKMLAKIQNAVAIKGNQSKKK